MMFISKSLQYSLQYKAFASAQATVAPSIRSGFARFLLAAILAIGATFALAPTHAFAQCSLNGTTETCTGGANGGSAIFGSPPVNDLEVNSLTQNLTGVALTGTGSGARQWHVRPVHLRNGRRPCARQLHDRARHGNDACQLRRQFGRSGRNGLRRGLGGRRPERQCRASDNGQCRHRRVHHHAWRRCA